MTQGIILRCCLISNLAFVLLNCVRFSQWDIGQLLQQQQQEQGWGAGVITKLARDLHNALPEEKGFSERNLKRMLAFYRAYPSAPEFVPQAVAQIQYNQKMPPSVAQIPTALLQAIPWGHHIMLIEKIKDVAMRGWYMEQIIKNGWSRNVLDLQISSAVHQRQGAAITNFQHRLPPSQSDFAQQTLKDPYLFDFLTLEESFHERELEVGLIAHLETFLLELGQGFAFVGRQYHISVSSQDFYIDLLFYHLKLRSYVVIELKRGEFKPEYAGKLNFYCNIVDDVLRHENDHPTIGLILCQSKDNILAEYALRGIDKPIGIASYELTRTLPKNLQSVLPTIEEIEAELQKDPSGDAHNEENS